MIATMKPTNTASTSLSSQTDEELLVRYQETGDRDLFAHLVHRYERELYTYLRRYLGDAQMAEDVFQAAFLQVHLKCEQFEAGRRFRPWLYTIATNQAIDAQRRNKRHQMVSLDRVGGEDEESEEARRLIHLMASQEPNPSVNAGDHERNELIRDAVNELPEGMRLVVHLVYYQGLKYREAAETLAVPVGTVKSRLHAAVAQLARWGSERHPEFEAAG